MPNFEVNDLLRTIKEGHFKTIDELLAALPLSLRRNYTLMYGSRSRTRSSFAEPRILFSNHNGTLLLGIGGNKSDQTLEVISYDGKRDRYEFSVVTSDGLLKYDASHNLQQTCMACHDSLKGVQRSGGQDPIFGLLRPNWDSYRIWAGAYGSVHIDGEGTLIQKTESDWFEKFKNNFSERYSLLPDLRSQTLSDLTEKNLRLTSKIYETNNKRIVENVMRQLENRPELMGLWLSRFDDSFNFKLFRKKLSQITLQSTSELKAEFAQLGYEHIEKRERAGFTINKKYSKLVSSLKLKNEQRIARLKDLVYFERYDVRRYLEIGFFLNKFLGASLVDIQPYIDSETIQFESGNNDFVDSNRFRVIKKIAQHPAFADIDINSSDTADEIWKRSLRLSRNTKSKNPIVCQDIFSKIKALFRNE